MEINSACEKVKKERKEKFEKFNSKTMCPHSKWANEQTLKTSILLRGIFFKDVFWAFLGGGFRGHLRGHKLPPPQKKMPPKTST